METVFVLLDFCEGNSLVNGEIPSQGPVTRSFDTIQYVKPTAQMVFKIDYQKVDQHVGCKWLIHDTKRRQDNQLQSLKETPQQNIQVE